MRVLVLDDDADRQQAIRRNNPGHDMTGVESASEAIRLMERDLHEIVMLDHDLDDYLAPDASNNGTGLHVVRWITNCDPDCRPSLTVVHSTNAVGAGDMMRELTEADLPCLYLPEAWARPGLIDRLQSLLLLK
ncbi:MAG: response regulator [Phycisphaerae bacterium]|nr:response regulator [Phycisphaerae bacterium]